MSEGTHSGDPSKVVQIGAMPPSEIQAAKAVVRHRMKKLLHEVKSEDWRTASEKVRARIGALPSWLAARSVLLYASLSDELDVSGLMVVAHEMGKIITLPRYLPAIGHYEAAVVSEPQLALSSGRFGVLEPPDHCAALPMKQLDFVLVPGVAFDSSGRRLGRGKGFYDRLLAEVPGIKCGICLDEQVVERIPTEPHDVILNCLITPTYSIDFACGRF
jgi:5-formyltetrahydrofolate cyclo-ligase